MAAAPIPLLVLSLLLLAVAVTTAATFPTTVNAYTPATGVVDAGAAAGANAASNIAAGAAAGMAADAADSAAANIGAYIPEAGYNPGKLCDNAVVMDSCVEVLPRIPGALAAPDYRALAVILDAYAWKVVQGSRQIADSMRAAEKLGHTMDKCISTCILGLGAAEAYLAALQPLPVEDRLHSIHDGLSALFRDGSDVPAAYSTGCPAGSIRNVDEESVVATFRNVYAVLDLLEQDLSQVYSSATPSTPTPAKPAAEAPAAEAAAALEKECDDAAKPEPASAAAKETSTPTLEAKAYDNAAGAAPEPAAATAAKESSTPMTATPVAQAYDNAGAGAAKEEPAAAAAKESSKDNYGGASQ
uniref:Pectinesterase inhibitor domain-containing protein n=1 Tax=Oryza meridionalis TaxID=40149 RepID=A0A0E0F4J9_9ORYZ